VITTDTSKLLQDLKKFHLDAVRRLEQMVAGFAYEFVMTGVENTPLGDVEEHLKLYQQRQRRLGLDVQAGFAQGSWQVALDNSLEFQDTYSGATAIAAAKINMMNYKLGQSFVIGNTGPYIGALENNYSPQTNGLGIIKPTVDLVMSTYKINLVRYYKQ
jgi:hypothetical protein